MKSLRDASGANRTLADPSPPSGARFPTCRRIRAALEELGPEWSVLAACAVMAYGTLVFFTHSTPPQPDGMAPERMTLILAGFFLFSFTMGTLAVLGGIGGGVIYTPILLAFAPIHSLLVRATGLLVAMFGGLISSGPLLVRGPGNLKLAMLCNIGCAVGGILGARSAVWGADQMGMRGEGIIRVVLGILVAGLGLYFLAGGARREWPTVNRTDRLSRWLNPICPYYEPSLGSLVEYRIHRVGWGILLMAAIGFIAGFFGLGAGWAIVPALNCVMGVPLKVAASVSVLVIGMSGCVAIWPYFFAGAVMPILVAPWVAGQVLGGILGAHLMRRMRPRFIRYLLLGLLAYTSFGLLTNGLRRLGVLGPIPGAVHALVLLSILVGIIIAGVRTSVRVGTEKGL